MQPQRETMTDNLADIIHIIHIGCKSGTLTVERGEGNTLEEGFILFIEGRAVEAKVGQRNGMAAFNYLNMWQTCRFAFVSQTEQSSFPARPTTQPLTPQPRNSSRTSGQLSNATTSTNTDSLSYPYQVPERQPSCPLRTPSGEVAVQHPENFQLPRFHRRLLLLINGQRNVQELARLMVRNFNEVQALLNDLERSGFIQQ
jgi:hypothetical protein